MLKLYEIENEYQRILDAVYNSDGEITSMQLNALNELGGELELKAKNIGAFVKNMEAEESAIDNAVEALRERKRKIESKRNWLTDYLKHAMEKCNITEISSPLFSLKIKKNPCCLVIADESLIPEKYMVIERTYKIDKNKLKSDLKNGEEVYGAVLEYKNRLEIK